MVRDHEREVTPAMVARAEVTPAECAAMKLLYREGYSQADLKEMFDVADSTVYRHANDHCSIHGVPDNE